MRMSDAAIVRMDDILSLSRLYRNWSSQVSWAYLLYLTKPKQCWMGQTNGRTDIWTVSPSVILLEGWSWFFFICLANALHYVTLRYFVCMCSSLFINFLQWDFKGFLAVYAYDTICRFLFYCHIKIAHKCSLWRSNM